MQLTREVKDILEGIHFFLVESLMNEKLSGHTECLRKGLLLQLQALKEPYPMLQFSSHFDPNANIRNGISLPFLNVVDHVPITNGSSRMSTCSSGSTNYSNSFSNDSSTGYSGDGVIPAKDSNVTSESILSEDLSSENYEDFDDIQESSKKEITLRLNDKKIIQRRGSFTSNGYEDREDDEYSLNIEPVAFRNLLLQKCDHHGAIIKRSKNIIRNSKTYIGILSDTLLYLYQKETDDQQKKVIDVSGYSARMSLQESSSRRKESKEFSFELVQPGKKTHMFYCTKRNERKLWIESIQRSETNRVYQTTKFQKSPLTKVEETPGSKEDQDDEESDFEEYYEEFNSDGDPLEDNKAGFTELDDSEYYTVPGLYQNEVSSVVKQELGNRTPPERPPPPKILLAQRPPMPRPLPEAPQSRSPIMEEEDHPAIFDEIYCEIEETVAEAYNKSNKNTNSEAVKHFSLQSSTANSLSQEVFNTINERLTPLPEIYTQDISQGYNDNECYDVPNERTVPVFPSSTWKSIDFNSRPLPSLPPKCNPHTPFCDDDSVYKVPPSFHHCIQEDFYLVPPSNPIPVKPVEVIQETPKESLNSSMENTPVNVQGSEGDDKDTKEVEKLVKDSTKTELVNSNEETNNNLNKTCDEISLPKETSSSTETPNNDPKTKSQSSVKNLIAMIDLRDHEMLNKSPTGSIRGRNSKLYEDSKILSNKQQTFSDNLKKLEISLQVQRQISNEGKSPEIKEIKNLFKKPNFEMRKFLNSSIGNSENNEFTAKKDLKNIFTKKLSSSEDSSSAEGVYVAKFDYVSSGTGHLNFSRDDEIIVEDSSPKEDKWWKAVVKGKKGLVPKEYLRIKK